MIMIKIMSGLAVIIAFLGLLNLINQNIKRGKKELLLDMYNEGDITDKLFTKYYRKLNL